jgi:O-antigen/teichoic acid export membrane protein
MQASISLVRQRPLNARGLAGAWSALSLAGSRGLAMLAQVAVQIAVGALSGPVGLGVLQLFTAWSNVLGEVMARGWPSAVLKRVSVVVQRTDDRAGRREVDRARRAVMQGWPLGLVAVSLVVLTGSLASSRIDSLEHVWLAPALLASALLFALLRLGAEALKAADAPLTAITLENLALPSVLLMLCLACYLLEWTLSPVLLVLGSTLGLVLGATGMFRAVQDRLGPPTGLQSNAESRQEAGERRALWLGSVQAIVFLQLPFLILPAFTDTATIGIYSVAHKLVNVITTLLILLGAVYGPAFARAAADGDRGRLRRLLARTQWLSLGIFVPAAIVLLLSTEVLAGLFHVPPTSLEVFMWILVGGQTVNAATGLAGILLNMTAAAKIEWRVSLVALVTAVLLALPVGWNFGATGLAVLFSAVICLKNSASWIAARRHITHGEFNQ